MHSIKLISTIAAALMLSSASLQAQAAPQYNVTILPTNSQMGVVTPYGLNNLGEIVGAFSPSEGKHWAFLYSNGTTMDLEDQVGGTSSMALDINDNGQIVGFVTLPIGQTAFVFSLTEGVKNLGFVNLEQSGASAINNAGQIVGWIGDVNIGYQNPSVFLPDGTVITLGYSGIANDINDHDTANGLGQIVGSNASGGAFLYSDGTTLNFTAGSANSINNVGLITGYDQYVSNHNTEYSGFIYNSTDSHIEFLGDAIPSDINDAGWTVGYYDDPFSAGYPFLLIINTDETEAGYTS